LGGRHYISRPGCRVSADCTWVLHLPQQTKVNNLFLESSRVYKRLTSIKGVRWDVEKALRHHIEPLHKNRKAGAEVHFVFEFLKYLSMVEVHMREQAIQTPHDINQHFDCRLRDAYPTGEVLVVVNQARRVVKGVRHVVDS
jgi:hypothetical protein